MKKVIYSILFLSLFTPSVGNAQEVIGAIKEMWSNPVVYAFDEEVTWYFDLSGTTAVENEDFYIWIWSPSEPDAGNFNSSSDFAKLTYEGDMIWSFTLTPTVYFSRTPDEIKNSDGFWFFLKDKTGTKQTEVTQMKYTDFSAFYDAGEIMKAYPSNPSLNEGVSILFNSNLVDGFANAPNVYFHSGLNNWEVPMEYQAWVPERVEKTRMKNLGNGFYKMDLIPSEYYEVSADFIMNNIVFLFVAEDWTAVGPDLILNAAEYIPPPPAEFRFFPLQLSKKDFLGMTRINNERGVTSLHYTITAGPKVITGEFTGNTTEIKGFVDLVTALKDVESVTEIHVVVEDNNGRVITDTTIPLLPLD
ncbi:hypothetical protein V6B16_03800 [Salinimicrobium catena]|uniref:hypothetical protein n=1 Tax=Salinimicrobium catena TaxID=390640 RepID=UPI002FE4E9BA